MTEPTPDPTPVDRLTRTAMRLGPLVVLSKGIGFFVPPLIAYLFGVTDITDAFFYALAIPTFCIVLATNAAGTIATPHLAQIRESHPKQLPEVTGHLATLNGGIAILLGILATVWCVTGLEQTSQFSAETTDLVPRFLLTLLPMMGLLGANNILKACCDVQGLFRSTQWAGMWRGAVVLFVLAAGQPWIGPYTLPVAFSVGELVRTLVLLWFLERSHCRPHLGLRIGPETRIVLRQMSPLFIGEALAATPILVDKIFASWLDPGHVSVLEYADRLRLIPQLFVEGTLLPVAYATWSNLHAKGKHDTLMNSAIQSIQWLIRWLAPTLVLLIVLRGLLVTWVYEWGAFDAKHVPQTAQLLVWYFPGVAALMVGALAFRVHILHQRFGIILLGGGAAAIGNIALNAWWVPTHGLLGIAMASTVVWSAIALFYGSTLPQWTDKRAPVRAWLMTAFIILGSVCLGLLIAPNAHWSVLFTSFLLLMTCNIVIDRSQNNPQ